MVYMIFLKKYFLLVFFLHLFILPISILTEMFKRFDVTSI